MDERSIEVVVVVVVVVFVFWLMLFIVFEGMELGVGVSECVIL